MRHTVKIAYVDTEAGPTPHQVGQISGTPTIKAFVPKRSSAKNEKSVIDYDQAREVGDLLRFATGRMPNHVESIGDDAALAAFHAKANEWGLPRVLVFSNKAGATSSTLKSLSAEFRRRVLIGELKSNKHTKAVAAFGVTSYPTLLCLPDGQDTPTHRLSFEKKEATYHRLNTLIGKCALKKPVLKKPAASTGPAKEEL